MRAIQSAGTTPRKLVRQVDEYFLPIGKLVAEEVSREERNNLQNKIPGVLGRKDGRLLWGKLLQQLHV